MFFSGGFLNYPLRWQLSMDATRNRLIFSFSPDDFLFGIDKKLSRRFADIGANLTDEVFDGVYSGTKKHDPDRSQVLDRAWQVGVEKIILTVGTIFDCAPAFKIAATDGENY